jgi:adenylate cyclase
MVATRQRGAFARTARAKLRGVNDAPGQGSSRRLSPDQLAFEAGAPVALIDELSTAGAIRRGPDGLHELADVPRVRLANALASSGISVADLMHQITTGSMPFSEIPRMGFIPEATGRTFEAFARTFGDRADLLPDLYAAFGLATPPPETAMRNHEEQAVTSFMELWAIVDERPEPLLRAARIAGEGMRHMVAAITDLIDEFEGSPPQRLRRGFSIEDAIAPSVRQAEVMDGVFAWLRERHLEYDVFDRIVRYTELSLQRSGRLPARPTNPPAIAFVDLSGFTERTAQAGDELAAKDATTLQSLALAAAGAHRGRVVKLLGDGVMLRFGSAQDAVLGVLELMAAIPANGLPQAHAGIASGRIVVRDGDVYGHTVNLASRIASHAVAGELLLSSETADLLAGTGIEWEDAGQVALKGIPEPVGLVRIRAAERSESS